MSYAGRMRQKLATFMLLAGLGLAACSEAEPADTADQPVQMSPYAGPMTDEASDQRQVPQELQWLEHYYLDPQPDRVASLLTLQMAQRFVDNPSESAAIVGFLSKVFAANVDMLDVWFPADARVFDDERSLYYTALWQSGVAEADAILDDVHERGSTDVQLHIQGLRLRQRVPIAQIEVISTWNLDMIWGAFSATGDSQYVQQVIDVVEQVPADLEEARILGAAAWSLEAKAVSHELVYRTCVEYVAEAETVVSPELTRTVQTASRHWPSR